MCGIVAELSRAGDGLLPADVPVALRRRGPDAAAECCLAGAAFKRLNPDARDSAVTSGPRLRLMGTVLWQRGALPTTQPLEDAGGNVLLWNGEVFGGDALSVPSGASDTDALLAALAGCPSVPALLARVQGPFAFVYFHAMSRTLWYGRDPLGRRSLLRAELGDAPEAQAAGGPRRLLLLSSVALPLPGAEWRELPADGIHSVRVGASGEWVDGWHAFSALPPTAPLPAQLDCASDSDAEHEGVEDCGGEAEGAPAEVVGADRPNGDALAVSCRVPYDSSVDGQAAVARLLRALVRSVRLRVCGVPPHRALPGPLITSRSRVGILFSGGIDCMVLARLADLCLPPGESIDLINVAFGEHAARAPDRQTGMQGAAELRRLSRRKYHLIEVDIRLAELQADRDELLALLAPCNTVMDLNIGAALWYGARGRGALRRSWDPPVAADGSGCRYAAAATPCGLTPSAERDGGLRGGGGGGRDDSVGEGGGRTRCAVDARIDWAPRVSGGAHPRLALRLDAGVASASEIATSSGEIASGARVLLVGTGADEQLGGYGRHRTVYRKEGWRGLSRELEAERRRLWRRNLGRDDRVISDWGREARHPYLDEGVVGAIAATPLQLLCDLRMAHGVGDKMILRRLARMVGLGPSTYLQKRAIQFGTRIANKNVCGQATLDDVLDLAEVVHPHCEATRAAERVGDRAVRASLSKKRGEWSSASARADHAAHA